MDSTAQHSASHDEEQGTAAAPIAEQESDRGAREERRVPVGEAIRYRKRAQDAETRVSELASRLAEVEDVLDHTRDALESAERVRRIDAALISSGAVDLDAARLVTEATLSGDESVDIEAAVAELRRTKPFLFRTRRPRTSTAMGGRPLQAGSGLEDAAREAARSGERGALLRYLRARREST